MVDPIVNKNIKLMTSLERGGMMDLISTESYGVNAGNYNGRPCVAANFSFDENTGEIYIFKNYSHLDTQKGWRGSFLLAAEIQKIPEGFFHRHFPGLFKPKWKRPEIIRISLPSKATRQARITIELSVKMYNQLR